MTTDPAKGLIGSLLHGLAILDMFARDRPEIGIGEMAQELGVHRSTTSRLAATLAMAGYLEAGRRAGPVPAGRPKLAALGELVACRGRRAPGRPALPARPRARAWARPATWPCWRATEAVTIEVVDGWQTVRMHSWVGKRSPAHCSSMGKALLAGLPAAEFDARYPEARPRGQDDRDHHRRRDELKHHLAQVREPAATPRTAEELEPHLCCVAGPVFDRTGTVVASISVSGPDSRIDEASIPAIAEVVRHAAWQISARLGGATRPTGMEDS